MASRRNKKEFADRLVRLRQERRLTQTDLARNAGVSQTAVWNWENANVFPRATTIHALAEALGTSPEFLERGAEQSPAERQVQPEIQSRANSLNEIIQRARNEVAQAAGLSTSQVRIVLDYGG